MIQERFMKVQPKAESATSDDPRLIFTRITKRKHYCCKGRALTKGCHTKTLLGRVTQFWFSHSTLRIACISGMPMHPRPFTIMWVRPYMHGVMGAGTQRHHASGWPEGRCAVRSTRRPEDILKTLPSPAHFRIR